MSAEKGFCTIGQASRTSGVPCHVLRYWEKEFSCLKPLRDHSGRRLYRAKDMETIRQIRALVYQDGYRIRAAKRKMRGERSARRASAEKTAELMRAVLRELREIERCLP